MCTSVVLVYLNYYKEYFSKGVQHFSILITKTKPKYNIPSLLKLNQNIIIFSYELKLELKMFLRMSLAVHTFVNASISQGLLHK